MAHQLKYKNSSYEKAIVPTAFIATCILAFIAGVLTTVHFCRSMSYGMEMPGGWTMSMMWMRMPGQTWLASGLSFLLMWEAMMVAMMMPSALPTFLRTRRRSASLFYMASGYFVIWLIAGVGIYPIAVELAEFEMRSELVSRAVPLLSGATLIAVGAVQFSGWKIKHLLGCRSQFGCVTACSEDETSFQLGCKQGVTCCACSAAPMALLLVLGVMNPLVMIAVAIIITAEKLLPRPEITTRFVGIAAIFGGVTMIINCDLLQSLVYFPENDKYWNTISMKDFPGSHSLLCL